MWALVRETYPPSCLRPFTAQLLCNITPVCNPPIIMINRFMAANTLSSGNCVSYLWENHNILNCIFFRTFNFIIATYFIASCSTDFDWSKYNWICCFKSLSPYSLGLDKGLIVNPVSGVFRVSIFVCKVGKKSVFWLWVITSVAWKIWRKIIDT